MKMLTISETAHICGVSVRTLHHYDQISLLNPSEVSDVGYRYYDEDSLRKLQQILFLRELDFPLKEIAQLLCSEEYDTKTALKNQLALLLLKKERLERLITLAKQTLKGETIMDFKGFDTSEIDLQKQQYADEVKQRWGETDAYTQSEKRTKNYTKADWAKSTAQGEDLIARFSELVGTNPADHEAQALVELWQKHITHWFYDCSNDILAGLGQMYVYDERFTKNIDSHKKGTASFMSKAIECYCI